MKIDKIKEVLKKNEPNYVKGYNSFSRNLLVKNLEKFINVGLNRSSTGDDITKKADTFRRLVAFSELLQERLQSFSDDLVEANVELYFPQEKFPQKVIIVETDDGEKYAVVEPLESGTDWKKALKQIKRKLIDSGKYVEENFK